MDEHFGGGKIGSQQLQAWAGKQSQQQTPDRDSRRNPCSCVLGLFSVSISQIPALCAGQPGEGMSSTQLKLRPACLCIGWGLKS